ncbi:MAG: zf-HC2 domain-containing protein [Acidimicrobiales bacterium]
MRSLGAVTSRARCMAMMRVLQRYLDGALDEKSADRVATHLEACRRCGLEAETYQQIKVALADHGHRIDPRAVERLRRFGEQLAQGTTPSPGDHVT